MVSKKPIKFYVTTEQSQVTLPKLTNDEGVPNLLRGLDELNGFIFSEMAYFFKVPYKKYVCITQEIRF